MNAEQYISSGIIEQYVLGLVTETERLEVERMADRYPEVQRAIAHTQRALERYARAHSVPPPNGLKPVILATVIADTSPPGTDTDAPREATTASASSWRWWYIILPLVGIVIGFGIGYALYQPAQSELEDVTERYEELQATCTDTRTQNDRLTDAIAAAYDPQAQRVSLGSVIEGTTATATVLYAPEQTLAQLYVQQLPTPPTGKQYQLWALVGGQPRNMGVFEYDNATVLPVEVSYVADAGAFAITLENEGGSPVPSLDQMYVLGKI